MITHHVAGPDVTPAPLAGDQFDRTAEDREPRNLTTAATLLVLIVTLNPASLYAFFRVCLYGSCQFAHTTPEDLGFSSYLLLLPELLISGSVVVSVVCLGLSYVADGLRRGLLWGWVGAIGVVLVTLISAGSLGFRSMGFELLDPMTFVGAWSFVVVVVALAGLSLLLAPDTVRWVLRADHHRHNTSAYDAVLLS